MSIPPQNKPPQGLNYRDAGVDIDAGDELVQRIKPAVARTRIPGVLSGLGGFGGLFELAADRYRNPVLVSGTDGVGTKLKLAQELGIHNTIGIDLVAMCVNDIVVSGAQPLFFLDYFATGKLCVGDAAAVIEGITEGCLQAGAALIGGETAEMPGMYAEDEYDLAGFSVGVVEKDQMLDPARVQSGDVIIGLASSGPHSNGYSLIRRIIDVSGSPLDMPFADSTLGETLLTPTRIYVKTLLPVIQKSSLHALAHITGGGITENLPRVLPQGTRAIIDTSSWQRPEIFHWLQKQGRVEESEMLRTFNCGIGMMILAAQDEVDTLLEHCASDGIESRVIGHVEASSTAPAVDYK